MKQVLSLLFTAFISLSGYAQLVLPGFPVRVINMYASTKDRAEREGVDIANAIYQYPSGYLYNGVVTPSANGGSPGTYAAPVTIAGWAAAKSQAAYISGIYISTSEPVVLNIRVGDANTAYRATTTGQQFIPIERTLYGGQATSVAIYGRLNAGTGGVVVSGQLTGYVFANDWDVDAPYRILGMGNSNHLGSSIDNTTTKEDTYMYQLKNWFMTARGQRARIIDKSMAGQTSSFHETLRQNGRLDVTDPHLIILNTGLSDTDTALYRANIKALIAYKQLRYPTAKMIVCGNSPRSGTLAATVELMRQKAQQAVLEANDPTKVYYCNLGNAFPTTDDTYFSTQDGTTAGQRVHANKAGHILLFQVLRDFIVNNNITLNALQIWQVLLLLNILLGVYMQKLRRDRTVLRL